VSRIIIYTRLSVADDGLSQEVQGQQVAQWAAQHGHEVTDVIRDDGVSGGVQALRRSGFALAHAMTAHGRADLIVAAKLDRIGRSMLDVLDLIERQKVPVFSLDLPADITTSHGGLALHMLAAFAEAERRRISERTTAALHGKIRRGERVGRVSALTPRVRERIVSMQAEGMSLSAIARVLNDEGVPTSFGGSQWRHPSVHAVLATARRHAAISAA
jgi:DNA invertase Pin-like site-specific DNA recombinase